MSADSKADGAASPTSEVTLLLRRLSDHAGAEAQDGDRLLELIYGELRRLASSLLSDERLDHTLQPTALVHEAWMRLADQKHVEWQGKAHFFAIAARAMRRILVDHARAKRSEKRGSGWGRVELDAELGGETSDGELLRIDEALNRLGQVSPEQARLVELRFFTGLAMPRVAEVLGQSLRSTEREWRFARAWLMNALGEEE